MFPQFRKQGSILLPLAAIAVILACNIASPKAGSPQASKAALERQATSVSLQLAATQPASQPVIPTATFNQKISFSVGPDKSLTIPKTAVDPPDEHTTILPPAPGSKTYLFFVASRIAGVQTGGGTVALETTDLRSFTFADGYASPVMSPALSFNKCKPSYDPEFDLNYAAAGSVVQDPTRPSGNLIMIYEAENHCPGAVWQHDFYATVGFARSSDDGKTWPKPVDSELGGPDRYPILKPSLSEPTTPESPPTVIGDAIPSAFIDGNFLYVAYKSMVGSGGDSLIRVARAPLGGDQLSFLKWYNGAFTQPGISGLDSGVMPAGACGNIQHMAQISYNDTLKLYMITFVCNSSKLPQAAWYFSTATSLDRQDWTPAQMIENSQFPITQGCASDGTGSSFDGWYPSFMSPGSTAGHLSTTGSVFFMNGCDRGSRTFTTRTFTIQTSP